MAELPVPSSASSPAASSAASSAPLNEAEVAALVASRIADVPDFPKPGVMFKDFTPLLADGHAFGTVVRYLAQRHRGSVDVVAGIEARGFILAAAVALELGLGMVPIRKAGKLPGDIVTESYSLEYGTAEIEVQTEAFTPGQRVLMLDDVLATGGTAAAACTLVERCGASVECVDVILELSFLGGRAVLPGRRVHALLTV